MIAWRLTHAPFRSCCALHPRSTPAQNAANRRDRQNYLIPVDVEALDANVWYDAIKLDDIISKLSNLAGNAAHFVIFDACRNLLKMQTKGGKGFLPVSARRGMLIGFSTDPGETASDAGDGSGPYAAALAAELIKPGQDHLDVFQNVKERVHRETGGQVPWERNGLLRRVRFAGKAKAMVRLSPREQLGRLDAYLRAEFKSGSADLDYRVLFQEDLNGDGLIDYGYIIQDIGWCGSGGCAAGVLRQTAPGKFQSIYDLFGIFDVRATRDVTNGMRNLHIVQYSVQREIGRPETGTPIYSLLRWTGRSYELSHHEYCAGIAYLYCSPRKIRPVDARSVRRTSGNLYATPDANAPKVETEQYSGTIIGKFDDDNWCLVKVWKGASGFAPCR